MGTIQRMVSVFSTASQYLFAAEIARFSKVVGPRARERPHERHHARHGQHGPRGDRVELRGFGAFTIKTRPARRGRNPKNGAFVDVREKRHPVFKMGKPMLAKLNPTPPS
jgi:hypothetical protein